MARWRTHFVFVKPAGEAKVAGSFECIPVRETACFRNQTPDRMISVGPGQRRADLAAIVTEAFLARVILAVLIESRKIATCQERNRKARREGGPTITSRLVEAGRFGRLIVDLIIAKAQGQVQFSQKPLLQPHTHPGGFGELILEHGRIGGTIRVNRQRSLFEHVVIDARGVDRVPDGVRFRVQKVSLFQANADRSRNFGSRLPAGMDTETFFNRAKASRLVGVTKRCLQTA